MRELEQRLETLEKKVRALETALKLSLASAKPTTEWLDAQMNEINRVVGE